MAITTNGSSLVKRVGTTDVITGKGSGGTEVTSGGYKYHTFTGTSTFTATQGGLFEVLVVGGGGGGAKDTSSTNSRAPGAGAGGVFQDTIYLSQGDHTVTVGSGGAAGTDGNAPPGNNSSVGSAIAVGGGGGDNRGDSGGSGSGSWDQNTTPGTGFQGSNGGKGYSASGYSSGGGGGYSTAGLDVVSRNDGRGDGGDGIYLPTWATATSTGADSGYYAGGGGGASWTAANYGRGGLGGGGDGSGDTTASQTAGTANTGGGAGGTGHNLTSVGGGSGIVIIRYAV